MSLHRSLSICLLLAVAPLAAQAQAPAAMLLKPARVFDGEAMHQGWAVRVAGDRIQAAGPAASGRCGRRQGRPSWRAPP